MPSSPFASVVAIPWMPSSTFASSLHYGAWNCTQYSREGLTSTKHSGRIPSCDRLATLCLMHPQKWFALLVARAHCWLMRSLLSTSTPRSLSAGLLSGHSPPCLCLCLALLCPGAEHSICLCWMSRCCCPSRALCLGWQQGHGTSQYL